MSNNLVRIRPARWQFDAIGSNPRLVEDFDGPTFTSEDFEPKPRNALRGRPVQPGSGEILVLSEAARLHRDDCFWHIVWGSLFAALVPFALASGMIGAVLGGIGFAVCSAWQFHSGRCKFNEMADAILNGGYWGGVYYGREHLWDQIERNG